MRCLVLIMLDVSGRGKFMLEFVEQSSVVYRLRKFEKFLHKLLPSYIPPEEHFQRVCLGDKEGVGDRSLLELSIGAE